MVDPDSPPGDVPDPADVVDEPRRVPQGPRARRTVRPRIGPPGHPVTTQTVVALVAGVVVAGFAWWRVQRPDVGYEPPPLIVTIRVDTTRITAAFQQMIDAIKRVGMSAEDVRRSTARLGAAFERNAARRYP